MRCIQVLKTFRNLTKTIFLGLSPAKQVCATFTILHNIYITCDKCTYCKLLWTKASAKCPKCKCEFYHHKCEDE